MMHATVRTFNSLMGEAVTVYLETGTAITGTVSDITDEVSTHKGDCNKWISSVELTRENLRMHGGPIRIEIPMSSIVALEW